MVLGADHIRAVSSAHDRGGHGPASRVLVLGAGVAGLQAIATARRLGAVVEAYDVRAAAGEQVRSLGAKFLEVDLGGLEYRGQRWLCSRVCQKKLCSADAI